MTTYFPAWMYMFAEVKVNNVIIKPINFRDAEQ